MEASLLFGGLPKQQKFWPGNGSQDEEVDANIGCSRLRRLACCDLFCAFVLVFAALCASSLNEAGV